jgi:hypothetical protein
MEEPAAPMMVDAAVQAQVALRLVAGLIDHLSAAGVLAPRSGGQLAETAAVLAESGVHSQRDEIAAALRRIIGSDYGAPTN